MVLKHVSELCSCRQLPQAHGSALNSLPLRNQGFLLACRKPLLGIAVHKHIR